MTSLRKLHRPIVVVDRRTYRKAVRQIDALVSLGDFTRAWIGTVAVTRWLNSEQHYGRQRRRAWMREQLATWTARGAEYKP